MFLKELKPLVALCKRRGFFFPASELYGGFANTYSYGHYGCLLKKAIKDLWWQSFVQQRSDVLGLDSPILLHPDVWTSSGHTKSFHDILIECKECHNRYRLDHLLKEVCNENIAEGLSFEDMNFLFNEKRPQCPKCRKKNFTEARQFNLMFKTNLSKTESSKEQNAYLRPETAQGIFVEYVHALNTSRKTIPFGIAQIGKAFRNEITPGNCIFRTIEFEQMEIEFFVDPDTWCDHFKHWEKEMALWAKSIGLKDYSFYEIPKDDLPHYSKKNCDMLFDFPFGTSELYGLAYRTDHDLMSHSNATKKNLTYLCPKTGKRYIPHVIEPSFGLDRTVLAVLCQAYEEELLENGIRTVFHFEPIIAPIKCAFFPLVPQDEDICKLANKLYKQCMPYWQVEYDSKGGIGKRYRRQDELGTPFCVTVDTESINDDSITVRFRDSMKQVRISSSALLPFLQKELSRKLDT